MILLLATSAVAAAGPVAAQAQHSQPAPGLGNSVSPPAVIVGLDTKPLRPLEFSRAWLGKAAEVRQRRAELRRSGRLDGMDLSDLVKEGAALNGTLRIPVIPIHYADVPVPFPTSVIDARLFGPARGDTVSLASYWEEVSGGLLEVEGVVTPWIRLRREASYYLPRETHGWARFGRIGEIWQEALEQADQLVDFGKFDNDGPDGVPNSGDDDGHVDFVVLLVATRCDDWRTGAVWPHRGAMPPFESRAEAAGGGNIKVADYVILPVVDPSTCGPIHVGVLAHEAAHAFGLPDLYDYDGTSQGIGGWGLMGTGAHGTRYSPAHLGAWSKEQLGWVRVDWIDERVTELDLASVLHERRVLRYDIPGRRGEYLLLENRQKLGSDRRLPGHGLLIWRVDPDRGELGVWNTDARRRGVSVIEADGRSDLARGRSADAGDPFPGRTGRTRFQLAGVRPLHLSRIREDRGRIQARVQVGFLEPALVSDPQSVWLTAGPARRPATQAVTVRREAGAGWEWSPRSQASWLRVTRSDEFVHLQANPWGLEPGLYTDTVRLEVPGQRGRSLGTIAVHLNVPNPYQQEVVATGVSWSWGLGARHGDLFQASYGWDGLGLRARPRLLHLRDGQPEAETMALVQAEALYAPVPAGLGRAYVLAHSNNENYLYHVERDGRSRVVARVGEAPAYGAAPLQDGSVLVADWSGSVVRVTPAGRIEPWTELHTNVYQIATDATGTLYAAMFAGGVLRLEPSGANTVLQTGFDAGRLVAVAAAPPGGVFAAERGGQGRILWFSSYGARQLVTQVPGAHFYGLAVDGEFLYALDMHHRQILRIPLPAAAHYVAAP